jgi:hypothetical protein
VPLSFPLDGGRGDDERIFPANCPREKAEEFIGYLKGALKKGRFV